ncbi:DNA polymerase III subunit chi [Serratia microhaemolytica]|uniref:DNA polymerase III subunit chi n=1 Tax=Serratia microhaemolytica TaxID=2675110 RepID=UPI000FDF55DE|nr:DNA polymerase III subunit chi [Serratia microhaemolytica]
MKQVTFYLLEHDQMSGELSAHEALACQIAAERWRAGLRVLIACDNQQQALRLDEALWQREPPQFVPHNLVGEGPGFGAPVELCWPGKRNNAPRDVLITLQGQFADFATAFHQVVDFVPYPENLKQLARERYKTYRSVGFHLTTAMPPTHNSAI